MKKVRINLLKFFAFFFVLILAGCPDYKELIPVTGIKIMDHTGIEKESIIIEAGQTITLKAETAGADTEETSIIWEIPSGSNAAILSSGSGAECTIIGLSAGNTQITVKAWRSVGDNPRTKTISVIINTASPAAGINSINGPLQVNIGETQVLTAELVPAWASGGGGIVTWSQNPQGMIEITPISNTTSCTVKGLTEGSVTITASLAGNITKDFTLQITPSVLPQGDPVTGLRVIYNTADIDGKKLPVSNIIWLYPGDTVTLEAETTGGTPADYTWTTENAAEVQVGVGTSHSGKICTLTGVLAGDFYAPPTIVRVTAQNSSNTAPTAAFVLVKTQPQPIWAWDRARDGHLNLSITADMPTNAQPFVLSSNDLQAGNPIIYTIRGRGIYTDVPIKPKGNFVPYTESGFKLNSSNNFSGNNPDPMIPPNSNFPLSSQYGSSATSYNSTRIMIGSNAHADTDNDININEWDNYVDRRTPKTWHGFDFLTSGKNIRISVDYEILWSAGASRDMWIMVNNNNANAAQSLLVTNSQLLVEPLIAARGTRATAVTTMDIKNYINSEIKGLETLNRAFIGIVALSNGGSIYVSGIRIEYED